MPVEIGPFQDIVEVGWGSQPSVLLIRGNAPDPLPGFTNPATIGTLGPPWPAYFDFTARLITPLGEANIGRPIFSAVDLDYNYFGTGPARRKVGDRTRVPSIFVGFVFIAPDVIAYSNFWHEYAITVLIDLRLVRQVLADLVASATAGEMPQEVRIEVYGRPVRDKSGTTYSQDYELTASLYRGARAEWNLLPLPTYTFWDEVVTVVGTQSAPAIASRETALFVEEFHNDISLYDVRNLLGTLVCSLEEMSIVWEADPT